MYICCKAHVQAVSFHGLKHYVMCTKTPNHVHLESHLSAESGHSFGSLGGRQEAPVAKIWAILTGIGSLAFAYEFSIVLLEIQVSEVQQNAVTLPLPSWHHVHDSFAVCMLRDVNTVRRMHQNDSSNLHLIELPKASWVTWGGPRGRHSWCWRAFYECVNSVNQQLD